MQPLIRTLALVLLGAGFWAGQARATGDVQLRQVFETLSFPNAVYLTHAGDKSDRLFVVEKAGIIRVLLRQGEAVRAETFLDIRSRVNSGPGEAGLLGLAFHPNYAANGKFYINYTYGNLTTRISEFQVSENGNRADASSERILLEVSQPASNHNGGHLAFGPDGYLYIGLGDGGGANDPYQNGQDLRMLLGAMLRIDVNGSAAGLAYGILADNPFVGNSAGWREEIWAWGLRNPWRYSFDRATGALWAADVGQNRWEEVNVVEKGKNYGWNIVEGFQCLVGSACDMTGLAMPVVAYPHAEGRSITGGYVYWGLRAPRLTGFYLYGDFISRKIWALRYENGQVVENALIVESPSPISSFGEDEAGDVYAVGYDGRIYIIEGEPVESGTGDFNGDGIVDFLDFLLFAQHYGRKAGDTGFDARFDLDEDGQVGFSDFLLFAQVFGKTG